MLILTLFAADDPSFWATPGGAVLTFVGVIFAIVSAVGGWLTAKINSNTKLQTNNTKLQEQIGDLQDKAYKCLERETTQKLEILDLQHEIKGHVRRINRLEKLTGVGSGEPHVGIVCADLKGIIRVFSPSLVPMFKWLPHEAIGKPITMLMSVNDRGKHVPAFDLFVHDEQRQADPTKVILGVGADRFGEELPVAVTVESWQVGKEGMVTATIRERIADDLKKNSDAIPAAY